MSQVQLARVLHIEMIVLYRYLKIKINGVFFFGLGHSEIRFIGESGRQCRIYESSINCEVCTETLMLTCDGLFTYYKLTYFVINTSP